MGPKNPLSRFGTVRDFRRARQFLREQEAAGSVMMHPPGHYASPIPALSEIRERETEIFARPRSVPGIDAREQEQLALIAEFAQFYADQPFEVGPGDVGLRYHLDNKWFGFSDGIVLHCMLRWTRPRRIIEVGSGFSSAVILDTRELFLDGDVSCTFIEPYPDRLRRLLRDDDPGRVRIIEEPVQKVELDVFDELENGDVLFIDSSHVSKVGSDVNRLVFDVLPRLRPGVLVHFHDIGWPFEYPSAWIYAGRAWNEAYLVRALLTFSRGFEIVLSNHFLSLFHQSEVAAQMPLWGRAPGGSLWIRRTQSS
jgi:predicted O-methyltransferase YrrM